MPKLIYIFIALLTVCHAGCVSETNKTETSYRFFVAGHVYGHPMDPATGLHPPFAEYIPTINADSLMAFGFFAGDMVYRPTESYWSVLDSQRQLFDMPIYLVAGNHDRGPLLDERLPQTTYTFTRNGDTFIILDAGDDWTLQADQLHLLKAAIAEASEQGHVFVLMHELLWWSPDGLYSDIKINYAPHYPGKNNFETEVLPILQAAQRPITLIAGDLGASEEVSSYSIDTLEQVTLLATGMGDGKRDHMLKVEVSEDTIAIYRELLTTGSALILKAAR